MMTTMYRVFVENQPGVTHDDDNVPGVCRKSTRGNT